MWRSVISRQLALAAGPGSSLLGKSAAAALGAASAAGGGVGSTGWLAAAAAGALHTCAPLLASLQVRIPALGESISDGTVSAVLKKPGDRVEEDEAIVQIETDKVTVDVRSPKAGVIEAILVKEDDNVEVGHVVASIADGVAVAASAAAPQPAAAAEAAAQPEPEQQQAKAAPAAAAAPTPTPAAAEGAKPAGAAAPHRTPSIHFPPRRTPEGEQISAMPREAAQQLLANLLTGGGGGGGQTPPAAVPFPEEYKHMIAVPIVGGSMPILRGPPVPSGPPGPPRREMSEREMEAIMLGGAEP